MKKGLLLLPLLLFPMSILPALDVYLNGGIWHHYSAEALESVLIPRAEGAFREKGIPLRELTPLMRRWDALRIRTDGGEIFLEGEELNHRLDTTTLLLSGKDQWILQSGPDIYSSPQSIGVEGVPDSKTSFTVMARPNLPGYREVLTAWAEMHKVDLVYLEKDRIRDEILHRKMLGDPLPDFTLTELHPADSLDMDNVISYKLRSVIISNRGESRTLVLPAGLRINPELFFSIMASRFGNSWSDETLSWTAGYYNRMLNTGVFTEKSETLQFAHERDRQYLFFPAENHSEQKGEINRIPVLPELEIPPVTRIIPVVMNSYGPEYREEALKSYLKKQGIQYSLYSPRFRYLPSADITALLSGSRDYENLLIELKEGYVLYNGNYDLWQALSRNLPSILLNRISGDLHE